MNRKTFAIVGAAGALAAAAVLLSRKPAAVTIPDPDPATCGGAAPANATQSFGAGDMTAALSGGHLLRGSDGTLYVSVDLAAREAAASERPPMSVAIVIDHSGSMQGDPLAKAKAAARGLIERLGDKDRAALVQYDSTADVLVPAIPVDVEGKRRLLAAIDSIWDRGGTNIGDGLALGRDEVLKSVGPGRVNRVILLSDGNANEGLITVPEFARLAANAAERGVRISAVGLGDSYNEDIMQAVAEHGRGRYYYARDAEALETVFAGELKSLQGTVATQAEVRLVPACGTEIVEVFGYETRREGQTVVVPLADLAGGDRRKVVARLRVPADRDGKAGVLAATFTHAGARGEAAQTTTVSLGVEVTSDASAVASTADKGVLGKVAQAEGSVVLRQAADAYARGDRAQAIKLVEEQKARTARTAKSYGVAAKEIAPAEKPLADFGAAVEAAPPAAAPEPAFVKKSKAEAYELAK